MISSMDLFFNRDCADGAGPEVEAPRVEAVPSPALALTGWEEVCAAGALGAPNRLEVAAGAVDVLVAAGAALDVVVSAGLPRLKSPPEGTAAGVEEAAVEDD